MSSHALSLLLVVMVVNHYVVPAQTANSSTEAPASDQTSTEIETTTTTARTTRPQPNNRLCPENSGMVDSTRVKAKTAHNYRRGRLARGQVQNKAGRNLPSATNMLRLEYDCSLEASAERSAKRCTSVNDRNLTAGVQENIHLFHMSQANTPADAIVVAVKQWWSQIRKTGGIGQRVTYTQYNVGQPTEWFTRMAWATTQHMGCAVVLCAQYWIVSCHYKTGGNVLGQQIYTPGTACSACPYNTYCNEDSLCQLLSAS